MLMNPIPLFFDECSILKKINMTSVFEKNAANNAQNCTRYHKFNLKISFFSSERLGMFWIAALMWVDGKFFLSQKKIIIVTLLLTEAMTGVYTEETFKSLTY